MKYLVALCLTTLLFVSTCCLPVGPHEIVQLPAEGTLSPAAHATEGQSRHSLHRSETIPSGRPAVILNRHDLVSFTTHAAYQHMNRANEISDAIPEEMFDQVKEVKKELKPLHRNVYAAKHHARKATLPDACLVDRLASATEASVRCARVLASGIEAGLALSQFAAYSIGTLFHRTFLSNLHNAIGYGMLAAPHIKEKGARCVGAMCRSVTSAASKAKNWTSQRYQQFRGNKEEKVASASVDGDHIALQIHDEDEPAANSSRSS